LFLGAYTCVATNKFGQATISAKLACSGKKDVLTESQIPQGLKVRDIGKKEDNLHWLVIHSSNKNPILDCKKSFRVFLIVCCEFDIVEKLQSWKSFGV
jgi:hypothetical protein